MASTGEPPYRHARKVIARVHLSQALAVYEYLTTIDKERILLWKKKWMFGTWLFAVNRYCMLANAVFHVASRSAPVGQLPNSLSRVSVLMLVRQRFAKALYLRAQYSRIMLLI